MSALRKQGKQFHRVQHPHNNIDEIPTAADSRKSVSTSYGSIEITQAKTLIKSKSIQLTLFHILRRPVARQSFPHTGSEDRPSFEETLIDDVEMQQKVTRNP